MGWICTAEASGKLERIERACKASREGTGLTSSNTFVANGRAYFYEVTRRDQRDGGIAGTLNVCFVEDGQQLARRTW